MAERNWKFDLQRFATVSGQLETFNLVNYVGELFGLSPTETPFLSAIGGMTGGRAVNSKKFTLQTYELPSADQPSIEEGADATYAGVDRSQEENVVQIHQEGVEVSYTKQAATGEISGVSILGDQPVDDEMTWQIMRKLEKIGRDVEYSFLQGSYDEGADINTPRQTRGILEAITTNTEDATGADLDKAMIDSLMNTMFDNGAPFSEPVILVNGGQKVKLSEIYGYAPEDRTIGGVNIKQIETDFGVVGVMLDRWMPADELLIGDLAYCMPVLLLIPDKGFLFREPMAKTGSADKEQIYGEIGLDHGPEIWHGKITNLGT